MTQNTIAALEQEIDRLVRLLGKTDDPRAERALAVANRQMGELLLQGSPSQETIQKALRYLENASTEFYALGAQDEGWAIRRRINGIINGLTGTDLLPT